MWNLRNEFANKTSGNIMTWQKLKWTWKLEVEGTAILTSYFHEWISLKWRPFRTLLFHVRSLQISTSQWYTVSIRRPNTLDCCNKLFSLLYTQYTWSPLKIFSIKNFKTFRDTYVYSNALHSWLDTTLQVGSSGMLTARLDNTERLYSTIVWRWDDKVAISVKSTKLRWVCI